MSINASLELFSLANLFRLIESDRKSGRLMIQVSLEGKQAGSRKIYYVWFKKGYFVTISDRLNHKGLISMIESRGWLSPLVTNQLRTLCPLEMPLGTYLQDSQLLALEQINLAFQMQLHQVYRLFELASGSFRFDEMSELKDRIMTIPWLEMTGNRLKATEVSLYALRLIKNWDIFADKLPASNLIFKRRLAQCPLKLMSLEWQLWQHIDTLNSLNTIAKQLNKPVRSVQIAAYRLLAVGLIEEIILPSLTLETIPGDSVPQELTQSQVPHTLVKSNRQEPTKLSDGDRNIISQVVIDVQPELEKSGMDSELLASGDDQNRAKSSEVTANTSILSDLIGLLRSQFKNS